MRAAVMRSGGVAVDEYPEPVPEFGQVLVQVKACGICGSDLHFVDHAEQALALGKEMEGAAQIGGEPPELDLGRDVFMGHEFSAEVLEPGPDTVAPAPGAIVTSIPVLLSTTGIAPIVYSNEVRGGYGERMLLSAPMLLEVPNELDPRHAALTEPMAVGLHAVNRSSIQRGDGAVVLGAGPVGLAVIAALKLRQVEPIVAADFSPARRQLAATMGAHETVDPRDETAFAAWGRVGGTKSLVVFEAVGVPGLINDIMRAVPTQSRVVVVGVCMERDTITPYFGIGKELNIQFVLAYDPMEFAQTLQSIAEGEIDVAPMITGEVGLDGVPAAFDELKNPERHCKILVTP